MLWWSSEWVNLGPRPEWWNYTQNAPNGSKGKRSAALRCLGSVWNVRLWDLQQRQDGTVQVCVHQCDKEWLDWLFFHCRKCAWLQCWSHLVLIYRYITEWNSYVSNSVNVLQNIFNDLTCQHITFYTSRHAVWAMMNSRILCHGSSMIYLWYQHTFLVSISLQA